MRILIFISHFIKKANYSEADLREQENEILHIYQQTNDDDQGIFHVIYTHSYIYIYIYIYRNTGISTRFLYSIRKYTCRDVILNFNKLTLHSYCIGYIELFSKMKCDLIVTNYFQFIVQN